MKLIWERSVPWIQPAEVEVNNTYAGKTKTKAKHKGRKQLRSKWESKALNDKYQQRVKQADEDQGKTHRWLKAAGLKAETEESIIAAQDQSFPKPWYQHNSLKKPKNADCVSVSTRPLTTWSLAALTWLKLNTSTTKTRQLQACTGWEAKSLGLRWRTMVWARTHDFHWERQQHQPVGHAHPHWKTCLKDWRTERGKRS